MTETEVYYLLMTIVFSVVAIAIGVITAREVIRKISRGLTKRAVDVCPHCENGIIWDAEFDKWFNCSACHGTGKRN